MIGVLSYAALAAAVALCIGWAAVLYKVQGTISALRRLPTTMDRSERKPPRVTAVLAARNESALIERAVRSLLGQEGVTMQVVAVDDSSEDDTLAKLRNIAETDDRLVVLSNDKLPSGWVAKNYALEMGQGRADGDWLLFTDADVIHGRRVLQNAVTVMEEENLDHLALHPRLEASTLIEAVVLPLYFLLCEFRFVNRRAAIPDSGIGAGVGAFNLVRAESYRLRGTHARIRGAVLDDRALGRMMRDEGGRGTLMRAVSQVRMRPYRSLPDLYVGIRKGVLSSFGNRATVAFAMGVALLVAGVAPGLLLVAGGPLAWAGHIPWVVLPALLAIALPAIV